MPGSAEDQRKQLDKERRRVDFDTYDITVDELIRRVEKGRIDVSPAYQRKFRWDTKRQSTLIESILLGIPVPPLFMATNAGTNQVNKWEVVDGLQRVTTLVSFAGNQKARDQINFTAKSLQLTELEKLESFNGLVFEKLPDDLQSLFEDRPLKVVVLNDKSDRRVRFDLFERINTGGIKLSHQEVRECVFRGPFIVMLEELAQQENFNSVIRLQANNQSDGTREEYILRFFAYLENYLTFEHAVKEFLDEYAIARLEEPGVKRRTKTFNDTFNFLSACFPNAIRSRKGITPVNVFEGIAVGAALALNENPKLTPPDDLSWINDDKFKAFTTVATNTKARVKGRIEYCRDRFLGR